MTLDEKLREIFAQYTDTYDEPLLPNDFIDRNNILAQIKQAFMQEGWEPKISTKWALKAFEKNQREMYGMMTGQEWYDRFKTEIESLKSPDLDDWHFTHLEVLAVAKKASGLSREDIE